MTEVEQVPDGLARPDLLIEVDGCHALHEGRTEHDRRHALGQLQRLIDTEGAGRITMSTSTAISPSRVKAPFAARPEAAANGIRVVA